MILSVASVCLLLAFVVQGAGAALSWKSKDVDAKKHTPFECGFTPKLSSRTPFSIQFFLMALIFLMFDMELIILFPALQTVNEMSLASVSIFGMFFTLLIYSFLVEWSQGMLEWVK